jgi:hypothetical protein
MKAILLAISSAILLTSCAGTYVSKTYVATGAVSPRTIYIRPFAVESAEFTGDHGYSDGETEIRRSLAPEQFAIALKEQLELIAPTMILRDGDVPTTGWIVEGQFDVVDAGSAPLRGVGQATVTLVPGRSKLKLHVRVIDVEKAGFVRDLDTKGGSSSMDMDGAGVIYAFDVAGGSMASAAAGSIYAPGLGHATPFDFRNAAELIYAVLSPDPHRYGVRNSPTLR